MSHRIHKQNTRPVALRAQTYRAARQTPNEVDIAIEKVERRQIARGSPLHGGKHLVHGLTLEGIDTTEDQ
jgi:hypothetical protein